MTYDERKRKIKKLQDVLNRTATQSNLNDKSVLDISKRLDVLILEHYRGSLKSQVKHI